MKRKKRSIKRIKKTKIFQKYKKLMVFLLIVFLLLLSVIYVWSQLRDKNCIIMITDSHACGCVKKRCISLKTQITDLLKSKFENSVRFKVVEYANKKQSEKIMKKYNMGMIPAVVILNKNGEAIYNGNFYNFNIEEFTNKLYELK